MGAVSRLRVTASRARLLERRPWPLPRHMLRATSALCTRDEERRGPPHVAYHPSRRPACHACVHGAWQAGLPGCVCAPSPRGRDTPGTHICRGTRARAARRTLSPSFPTPDQATRLWRRCPVVYCARQVNTAARGARKR